MNRGQIRVLNDKTTDLDWYHSRLFWKLKFLIRDLLFTTFVKNPPGLYTKTNNLRRGRNATFENLPVAWLLTASVSVSVSV